MTARARTRVLIDEMALSLLLVPKLGEDAACIQHLHLQGWRPGEILNYLDTARDIARATREGEADLWARILPQEGDPDT